ncbi:Phenazine biosynthesis PhzF protein [Penicillium fimorum]|uniref:Phenazine biosynthesis PhzF protein n=1 Tax=Penicillium fimorum TaxID=1882269 RepID=A0A9W9XSE9_9EURO|nr:Phenazine biosynthesis PhzF protein [Penicillium fimorum]
MKEAKVHVLRVSPPSPEGEDTIAVMLNAKDMPNQEMREVALRQGHMSGFVFPTPVGFEFCHYEIRFWTPQCELVRCSHVMIGTVWLLSKLGVTLQDNLRILTKCGLMDARSTKAVVNTDSTKGATWDI